MEPEEVDGVADSIATDLGVEVKDEKPAVEATSQAEEPTAQEAEAPAAAPAPTAEPTPPATPAPSTPPDTWTQTSKTKWATIPPDIQAEILKREGDMVKGIASYEKRAKLGDAFADMIVPFAPHYQRLGLNPHQLIPAVLNAHAHIMWGTPEQKIQMLQLVAQDAGIDLTKIGEGVVAAPPPSAEQQRIQGLEHGFRQLSGQIYEREVASLEQDVLRFAGDPKHPYFYDVADDIKQLVDSGAARTLEDAYELAVMRNPVTRARELERISGEAVAKAQSESKAKLERARRATAANVRSSEVAGGAATAPGTIDQTLIETLKEIKSRESA